mmetsp:Transcript_4115/g.8780  ORF Transcript_4115/g.8780 Transcript_4115/m.8780 type:complete len:366 (-) Transcript_4115:15-1112(-)
MVCSMEGQSTVQCNLFQMGQTAPVVKKTPVATASQDFELTIAKGDSAGPLGSVTAQGSKDGAPLAGVLFTWVRVVAGAVSPPVGLSATYNLHPNDVGCTMRVSAWCDDLHAVAEFGPVAIPYVLRDTVEKALRQGTIQHVMSDVSGVPCSIAATPDRLELRSQSGFDGLQQGLSYSSGPDIAMGWPGVTTLGTSEDLPCDITIATADGTETRVSARSQQQRDVFLLSARCLRFVADLELGVLLRQLHGEKTTLAEESRGAEVALQAISAEHSKIESKRRQVTGEVEGMRSELETTQQMCATQVVEPAGGRLGPGPPSPGAPEVAMARRRVEELTQQVDRKEQEARDNMQLIRDLKSKLRRLALVD